MKLTKEEFNHELNYLISKHLLKDLLDNNLINQKEYEEIKAVLLGFYKPLISFYLED